MHYDYGFTSHYLNLSHGRIHYLDEGHGKTVVLVHGNPTWSYYYRDLVKGLSSRYRVVAPDHIGCGLSDKPDNYDYILENHIGNLRSLLEHLDIRQTSMVVHDWGGPIGLGAVADGAIELNKLVILNTAAFRSTRIPLRIRICRWPVIGKLLVQGVNGFAKAAIFMAVNKRMSRETARGYLYPYDTWSHRRAIHEFVRDIPLHPSHRSYGTLVRIEKSLKKIHENKIPVGFFWGGKDFCFDDYYFEQWKTYLPQAHYRYFEEWGHYVLEDGKGSIERIIEDFLGKNQVIHQ
ncbi:MAG: alpha/beta hydrolase [Desulfofustis sp.]|nr:alpha/beta fold hydrolase [Desulfofustis sp.]MBT8344661.1 alpha/beta fold hydrolase [Desulfofustis sp.]NNF48156.1 alpha/beta hydrolase [Desulfofustis sp.]NNK13250.1 alpha/beta hydrolase [Desulfofustis sp.]NNK55978.1 alpha/beta hydrolase [Desulfofustis sp.]